MSQDDLREAIDRAKDRVPIGLYDCGTVAQYFGLEPLVKLAEQVVLSTDIDLNDIVEIDVEKLREYLIIHHFSGLPDEAADGVEDFVDDIIEGVAKSGCIRWRSKKEGKG